MTISQNKMLSHQSHLTVLDIVSFRDFELRSAEQGFLAKGINFNPLIPCCEDLLDANFISLDLSVHTRYSFFSSVCSQMFQKGVFSNICLNLLIPLILLNRAIQQKIKKLASPTFEEADRHTDRHTNIHSVRTWVSISQDW